ncbi:MAG: CdaR family protein [Candidatus Korobacteraceae bacterium]|jgi:YbbR domain-containing protein
MIVRIRHFLFDNLSLKLASLVIALLMWYGVARDPVAEISLQIPVEFIRPPKELDYISDMIPQAQIRLRGPARLLRDLPQGNVRVVIDLQGAVPGEHTYDITTDEIKVPHDVEIMQVTPSRLRLVFDEHQTRQVAVKPRVVGALPPGYRLESVTANPSMLTISGPARHVSAVEYALTDAVDATGVAGQASFETMAYLPDPLVHLSGSDPIHVVVITRKISSKAGVP